MIIIGIILFLFVSIPLGQDLIGEGLYENDLIEKQNTDKIIFSAANKIGFAKITGVKNFDFTVEKKQLLLSIFDLHKQIYQYQKKFYSFLYQFELLNMNFYQATKVKV